MHYFFIILMYCPATRMTTQITNRKSSLCKSVWMMTTRLLARSAERMSTRLLTTRSYIFLICFKLYSHNVHRVICLKKNLITYALKELPVA
uniref:Uncharacterized protein n=1 Tax=Oryza brachyantha TaxID=4533 RepID=J3L6I2_ORYBR